MRQVAGGLIFGGMTLLSFQTAPLFGSAIDLALGVQMFVRLMCMLFVSFLLAVLYESETARHAAGKNATEPEPETTAGASAEPSLS